MPLCLFLVFHPVKEFRFLTYKGNISHTWSLSRRLGLGIQPLNEIGQCVGQCYDVCCKW